MRKDGKPQRPWDGHGPHWKCHLSNHAKMHGLRGLHPQHCFDRWHCRLRVRAVLHLLSSMSNWHETRTDTRCKNKSRTWQNARERATYRNGKYTLRGDFFVESSPVFWHATIITVLSHARRSGLIDEEVASRCHSPESTDSRFVPTTTSESGQVGPSGYLRSASKVSIASICEGTE